MALTAILEEEYQHEDWQLAQGNKYGVKFTDTIEFIHEHEVPSDKKATCAQFVCDLRPLKPEPFCIRIVVGGDKLDCKMDTRVPSTDITEFKLLINSII